MFRKALLALALSVVAVLGVGSPALASGPGPSGYFTAWDGCSVGYCGAAWPIPPQTAGVCHSVPSGSNDKFTAVDNHTTRNIVLYKDAGCGGTHWTIYAGTYTGQLGSGANNTVSSYHW